MEPQPVFQVLEVAETPDMKSGPQRTRIILVATLLGLLGSTAFAFVRHRVRQLTGASVPALQRK